MYYKICNLDNIIDMAHKICVRTKNKRKVERFENHISEHIFSIKKLLDNENYIPDRYNLFLIREPKTRLIMSQSIRDKVINHLVAKYFLVDVFDNSFIDSSIATRENKGTHYGIKLMKKYLNDIKSNYKSFYALKFDIKKYFYNIDHEITKELLRRKIKDKRALNILDIIIDSTDEEYINKSIINVKEREIERINSNNNISDKLRLKLLEDVEAVPLYNKGKGFPIGNMTSQIFAILYLNELDHFIKEQLHCKYYIRYMDDGVILHHDKDYLKYCLNEIEKMLLKYKLELNMNKTKIDSIKNGVDFLGFRFYIKNNKVIMKLRNSTKKKFKRSVRELKRLKYYDLIDDKLFKQNLASYTGHLKWGNCVNLIWNNIFGRKFVLLA